MIATILVVKIFTHLNTLALIVLLLGIHLIDHGLSIDLLHHGRGIFLLTWFLSLFVRSLPSICGLLVLYMLFLVAFKSFLSLEALGGDVVGNLTAFFRVLSCHEFWGFLGLLLFVIAGFLGLLVLVKISLFELLVLDFLLFVQLLLHDRESVLFDGIWILVDNGGCKVFVIGSFRL